MRITYVGHATLLLEIAGVRVLTDPNFELTLGRFLPRVSAPGISLNDLPALDVLLLTHAHFDHLSFKSLDALPCTIPLYAPEAIAHWLVRRGYRNAIALNAGEQIILGGGSVRVHASRARHKGSRYGLDYWRSAANMYLLESDIESVFFAGDTGLSGETHDLIARVLWGASRELDVAMLPIGYAPAWKRHTFRRGHLTMEDALTLFDLLRARVMLPYHWGTFRHVTVGAHDAIERLRTHLKTYHARDRVYVIEPGETLIVDSERVQRGRWE